MNVLPENVNFNVKNFSEGNTPPVLQKIADYVLIAAAAGVIIGTSLTAPPFSLALGATIASYSAQIGVMFKAVSKLFGIKTTE